MSGFFEPNPNTNPNVQPWHLPTSPWTKPQIELFGGVETTHGINTLNAFIADPKHHICAIGGPVTTAEGNEGGERWSQVYVSVIYQERVLPNGGDE